MKQHIIRIAILILLSTTSCGQRQQDVSLPYSPCNCDSLRIKIQLLEEQNEAQEDRIKSLESDLEEVMSFVNM